MKLRIPFHVTLSLALCMLVGYVQSVTKDEILKMSQSEIINKVQESPFDSKERKDIKKFINDDETLKNKMLTISEDFPTDKILEFLEKLNFKTNDAKTLIGQCNDMHTIIDHYGKKLYLTDIKEILTDYGFTDQKEIDNIVEEEEQKEQEKKKQMQKLLIGFFDDEKKDDKEKEEETKQEALKKEKLEKENSDLLGKIFHLNFEITTLKKTLSKKDLHEKTEKPTIMPLEKPAIGEPPKNPQPPQEKTIEDLTNLNKTLHENYQKLQKELEELQKDPLQKALCLLKTKLLSLAQQLE